jgi:hypothetical protein
MNVIDAFLCVALAARIHRTDTAVVITARSAIRRLPRREKAIFFMIINNRSPLKAVETCLKTLNFERLMLTSAPN